MREDPWAEIDPPSVADSVAARRVDATLPWDFFWARGVDRRVLLTLRHATGSAPTTQLPRLSDIEVTLSHQMSRTRNSLPSSFSTRTSVTSSRPSVWTSFPLLRARRPKLRR